MFNLPIHQMIELGRYHHDAGRRHEAEACFRQVLQQDPRHAEALYRLALIAFEFRQLDCATELMRAAVAVAPEMANLRNDLGFFLAQQGQTQDAIAAYEKTVELDPRNAHAWLGLGGSLMKRGQFAAAERACRHAVALNPTHPSGYMNLGNALQQQRQMDDAIVCYRRALELDPQRAAIHWNLACALLAKGDLAHGWPEFEARRFAPEFAATTLQFTQPAWDGSPLDGRTILLHTEQGIGDSFHFVRYCPMVAERGGRIILLCPPNLAPILKSAQGVQHVVGPSDPLPPFDVHAPLPSLPFVFRTTLETIPANVPYLIANPGYVAQWRERFSAVKGLKIGLVWAGRPTYGVDMHRSCVLADFAPLGQIPGINLFSLQQGPAAAQIQTLPPDFVVTDLGPQVADFAQTAAAIAALDLVLAVDTAAAHLAGALARPVWTLLALTADWRWMLDRSDSPWYPTMRLFRQRTLGDWSGLMREVAAAVPGLGAF